MTRRAPARLSGKLTDAHAASAGSRHQGQPRQSAHHSEAGLTDQQAAALLARDGYNELASAKPRTIMAVAAGVVREPMFVLLIACGAIYLALGSRQEALMLLGFVFVVIGITLFQENKVERALEALRNLASPRAKVVRSGALRTVPGREVVLGDVLLLAEGDRIPADAALLESTSLTVDESLLTGESAPVSKAPAAMGKNGKSAPARAGADSPGLVFSGTLVVQGKGMARVTGTGASTAIGRIGRALSDIEPEVTRVQSQTASVVRRLAGVAGALALLAALWYGPRGPTGSTASWLA